MSDRERRPDSERLIGRVPESAFNPPDDLLPDQALGRHRDALRARVPGPGGDNLCPRQRLLGSARRLRGRDAGLEAGCFLNGFYETWPIVYGEAAYGFAKTGQTIVNATDGKCCNFESGDGGGPEGNWAARSQAARSNSWSMNRFCFANIIVADPSRLPFRMMLLWPRIPQSFAELLELAKALLGLHASFDRSMILLQDVVQILDRSMAAAAAQGSFRFHCGKHEHRRGGPDQC